jgi:bifunctional non-homologous end joining protein LigD
MLATPAAALPSGPEWTYEVKWDGYRALAVKDGPRVRLVSRNDKDLTRDFPPVADAVRALRVDRATLDGEIVALDPNGRPSFQALQHRATKGLSIVYYAFDLLDAAGRDFTREPLEARRDGLAALVSGSSVLLSAPLPGTPREIEREIRRLGLEGIVAKKKHSPYRAGQRSDEWIKVKFSPHDEFVVGGYKPAGETFDSILAGSMIDGRLYFAGKVRAGFTPHDRRALHAALVRHPVAACPFVNLPNSEGRGRWGEGITAADMTKLRWVQPRVAVEVAFVEWTRDGLLRHPRFVRVVPRRRTA